jgi:hypothetical protein
VKIHVDDRRTGGAGAAGFSGSISVFAVVAGLALVFLAFHLPYLPPSLEDLDSINFALGIRQFDVAQHQPHPPGSPLFMVAAKAVHALIPSEVKALSVLSILAGAFGVVAIATLFGWLSRDSLKANPSAALAGDVFEDVLRSDVRLVLATALAMACPLYWFTAARPLSDMTGLAAAIAVQAMIVGARTDRDLIVAAFCAALAAGIRSQVVWLTVPLLVVHAIGKALHHGGHGGHGGQNLFRSDPPSASSASSVVESSHVVAISRVLAGYVVGALVWAVPLVLLTGGPSAYWRALFNQGAEDLTGVQMLWTRPNVRTLVDALYYALIAPWAVWWIGAVLLALSAIGAVVLLMRHRKVLVVLAVAFGPYFVFDLLFQETFTSRYALPLVIPVAFLAVAGASVLPRQAGLVAVAVLAMYSAHIGGTSVAAFAAEKAPVFRLLDDMKAAPAAPAPVLAMDRREEFDMRRPIKWTGSAMPPLAQRLPSPPQHEWLELVKYWTGGGRAPVWFIADPLRADSELIQHGEPVKYRWAVPYPVLLGGVRPNVMDWHRFERPEWYLGEGWSLTPEAAGVAQIDRRWLAFGAIDGWISKTTSGGTLLVGGRNLESAPRSIALTLDEAALDEWTVAPGFFLRFVPLPAGQTSEYAKLTVRTTPPSRVAIEQFDASSVRPLLGYGDGWHEPEYNPQSGLRWRWLSEKGELKVRSPKPGIKLSIEGESPRRYFSRGSHLIVRASDRVVFDRMLDDNFTLDIAIPDGGESITLETDQFYAPADRSRPWRKSTDQRHLGLRIYRCELR